MGSIDLDKSPATDDLLSEQAMDESVVENADPAPELLTELAKPAEATVDNSESVKSALKKNQTNGASEAPTKPETTVTETITVQEKDTPLMTVTEKVTKSIPATEANTAVKPTAPVKSDEVDDGDDDDATSYTKASVFADLEKNPNRLNPAGAWPPPIFFDSLNASDQERFYLEHRWYAQWSYYDQKASQAKTIYQRLQLIIGIGSVTVPVLVGLNASNEVARNGLQLVTVAISLMVAASAAIESVKTYGDNWRTFRAAAEELNREKSLYDAHAGPYRRAKSRFLLFVERCEDIIAKQNGAWIAFKDDGGKDKDEDGDGIPDSQSGTSGNGALKP